MIYRGFRTGQRVRIGAGWIYGVITGVLEKPDGAYIFMVRIDKGGSGHRECRPDELRAVRVIKTKKGTRHAN